MKLFKTIKHSKLNSKGFSHIEALLLIAIVAIVGVTGYYVYQHHNKKTTTTAHAGGWSEVSTGSFNAPSVGSISWTGYACLSNSKLGSFVKGLVVTNKAIPANFSVATELVSSPIASVWSKSVNWGEQSTGWLYGSINGLPYHVVNLNITNYIQVYTATGSNPNFFNVRAGSLAGC